uniref:Uncharacterized protein n=1 Tax=Anguilla anguilla TaxID=7936 RepID=A0A0E9SIN4_ANGAN
MQMPDRPEELILRNEMCGGSLPNVNILKMTASLGLNSPTILL